MGAESVMRQAHLDDLRCADLVLGLVPDAERREALRHLAECPECEQRLRAHAAAAERARAEWLARAAASGDDRNAAGPGGETRAVAPVAEVEPRARILKPRRSWRAARWAGGLAAAAALIAVLALPLRRHAPLPSQWLPAPGAAVETREGVVEDPHLTAGLAAYRARDLAAADRELSAAQASDGSEQLRRLYLAQVRLARGHAQDAVTLLQGLDWRLIPEPWRRDGVALLARALRASGASRSADSLERALRNLGPSTPFVP